MSYEIIQSKNSIKALLVAFTIIGVWAASLIFLLTRNLHELHSLLIPLAIIWQTFLYTGLFITAHDAMHNSVFPVNRKINNASGTFVVFVYALFSYKNLFTKHWDHHKYPASPSDPDFHDGIHKIFSMVYSIHLFHVPLANLLLFWVAPSFLSTFQLFYFGTVLPHREKADGYLDKHRARSGRLPLFLSVLTCYHLAAFIWNIMPIRMWRGGNCQRPECFSENPSEGLEPSEGFEHKFLLLTSLIFFCKL